MPTFDPASYGPVIAALLQERRLMPLGPGDPNDPARPKLKSLTIERAFAPHPIKDAGMANACCAGLWLHHDFLDDSHKICQAIETTTGSYWHGIMHRREPDYSNSKYWFRRVGVHPIFGSLRVAAAELAGTATLHASATFLTTQSDWDPFAFIDLCEAASAGRSPHEMLCRQVQQCEWELLFDYCYHHAK